MSLRTAALLQQKLQLSDNTRSPLIYLTDQPYQYKINCTNYGTVTHSRLFPIIEALTKAKLVDLVCTETHLVLMLNTSVTNAILQSCAKYPPKIKHIDHRKNFVESTLNIDYNKLLRKVLKFMKTEYPNFEASSIINKLPFNNTDYNQQQLMSLLNMLIEEGEDAVLFIIARSIEQLILNREIHPKRFDVVEAPTPFHIDQLNSKLKGFLFHILSRSWSI